ncbi:hypothetical protein HUJ04_011125 [Dendroctonus ponderosae]|nr:hypothetical protein HUJ04_011125 [Dendroctonus ponderosae]
MEAAACKNSLSSIKRQITRINNWFYTNRDTEDIYTFELKRDQLISNYERYINILDDITALNDDNLIAECDAMYNKYCETLVGLKRKIDKLKAARATTKATPLQQKLFPRAFPDQITLEMRELIQELVIIFKLNKMKIMVKCEVRRKVPEPKGLNVLVVVHHIYYFNVKPLRENLPTKDTHNFTPTNNPSQNNSMMTSSLRHNNYLPSSSTSTNVPIDTENSNSTIQTSTSTCSAVSSNEKQVLLATALVKVVSKNDGFITARALLDNGSQTSFITENLAQKIDGKFVTNQVQIMGISSQVTQSHKSFELEFHSALNTDIKFATSCVILNRLTSNLPRVTLNVNTLQIPKCIRAELADPTFFESQPVDLLLGMDIYGELLNGGFKQLGKNQPVLINTYLGWTLSGGIHVQSNPSRLTSNCCNLLTHVTIDQEKVGFNNDQKADDLLQKFWTLEELPESASFSADDELAEQLFKDNTCRLNDGRFQNKASQLKYFLPHHCVVREDSVTTKLRVVFDASMNTSSGYSLNDLLLKGPQVQAELFDILCRFRTFKFVLVADIEKMYRQVRVDPGHVYLQNILWRDSPTEIVKCLELQTVTYGTSSAPFLATRCLLELAKTNQQSHPLAAEAILHQCYVDDIISGCNTLNELTNLHYELTSLVGSAGMSLHKWSSNSAQFFNAISAQTKQPNYIIPSLSERSKVLGMG